MFTFKKWTKAGTTYYDVFFGDMKLGTVKTMDTGRSLRWVYATTADLTAFRGGAFTRLDAARLLALRFAA